MSRTSWGTPSAGSKLAAGVDAVSLAEDDPLAAPPFFLPAFLSSAFVSAFRLPFLFAGMNEKSEIRKVLKKG